MQTVILIPARYQSSRFPGKPLADRTGKPLIQHVVEQVRQIPGSVQVVVATDDQRIAQVVRTLGVDCVMTRADHPNGTSRLAEAASLLGFAPGSPEQAMAMDRDCMLVNVQGDEPEIDPELITAAMTALERAPACVMSTVASPLTADDVPEDPNLVKVVVDASGRAIYFSRSLIPHRRADVVQVAPVLKHVGLYVYRPSFLQQYVRLSPTPLEQTEQLEQLRVLEHGHGIAVAIGQVDHHGIDTPEQYEAFVLRRQQAAAGN